MRTKSKARRRPYPLDHEPLPNLIPVSPLPKKRHEHAHCANMTMLSGMPCSVLHAIFLLIEDETTAAGLPQVCRAFHEAWDLHSWLVEAGMDECLVTAADEGRTQDLLALLAAGADLQTHGHAALYSAVHSGDAAAVHALLAAGVADLGPGADAWELAAHAAEEGRSDILAALLTAYGSKQPDGWQEFERWQDAALIQAAANGRTKDLAVLLEHGTSSFSASGCDIALREAVAYGKIGTVEALLKAGVRVVNGPDGALSRAVTSGRERTVQLLLKGPGMEMGSLEAEDALAAAAVGGHTRIVELLIAAGVDVGAWDDQALQEAAANGHWDACVALIAAGADVHAGGDEALRQAAANGHADVVEGLLDEGADADAAEAVAAAAAGGNVHVLELLVARRAGWNTDMGEAMRAAAAGGHVDCLRELVAAGATVCEGDNSCHEVFVKAAGRGDADTVAALLAAGVGAHGSNNLCREAMAVAGAKGHIGVMAVLLAAASGDAAVDVASERHMNVVGMLQVATAAWPAESAEACQCSGCQSGGPF